MTVQSKNIHEYESSAKIVFQDDPLTPMYRNEVADFVDCIVHDKPSPVTAEEGLKVLEIVDAVFESNRTGKPVQFPLTWETENDSLHGCASEGRHQFLSWADKKNCYWLPRIGAVPSGNPYEC
jgi:hypothetical protein